MAFNITFRSMRLLLREPGSRFYKYGPILASARKPPHTAFWQQERKETLPQDCLPFKYGNFTFCV